MTSDPLAMRVLHITPSLEVSSGGPAQVVAGMASALTQHGVEVTVATTVPAEAPGVELVQSDPRVDVRIFPRGRFSKFWNGFSRPLAHFIASEAPRYDLIHTHEMWHYPQFVAYRQARRLGIPFVVSPHGCLTPLALANDRLLKIVYTRLVQRRILKDASLLHAVTKQEAEQIRTYGVSTRTEIIQSGIVLAPECNVCTLAAHDKPDGGHSKPLFRILFLGRVVPNKGLDLLIRALSELKHRGHSVQLAVAGPYSEVYHSLLSSLADRLGVKDEITFIGFVTGDRKSEAFSSANAFVLPSHTEGFSIAALEAMAWQLPVVLTRQSNFPEVAEAGAGLEIEPDVEQLATAIERLLKEPEEAKMMGCRGRRLVERTYTWDAIAPTILTAYQSVVSRPVAQGVAENRGPV